MNPEPILFGQVPLALLRDPDVPAAAKALYGLIHSYCYEKNLLDSPYTHISTKTLAKDMGVSGTTICSWMKRLRQKGWVEVKMRGPHMTNRTTLIYKRPSRDFLRGKARAELNKVNRKIINDSKLFKRLADSIHPEDSKNT